MTDNYPEDDKVGYGKPPRKTRFRPGQSGNPAGRPKGPQTLTRDLIDELREEITLGDGGSPRTLSKQRSILRSLTARAIEGDPRATAMVLDLVQRLIGAGPGTGARTSLGPKGRREADPFPVDPAAAEDDPRERLAAKIAAISRRLAETERGEEPAE